MNCVKSVFQAGKKRDTKYSKILPTTFFVYAKDIALRFINMMPSTSEQNGLSERNGRTIMDVTRCLLNGAALPKALWGGVGGAAGLLLHDLPNKIIGGDTPYYKMFGKHTNLCVLRSIGAHGFVHSKGHLRKLDPRAREGDPHQLR